MIQQNCHSVVQIKNGITINIAFLVIFSINFLIAARGMGFGGPDKCCGHLLPLDSLVFQNARIHSNL